MSEDLAICSYARCNTLYSALAETLTISIATSKPKKVRACTGMLIYSYKLNSLNLLHDVEHAFGLGQQLISDNSLVWESAWIKDYSGKALRKQLPCI